MEVGFEEYEIEDIDVRATEVLLKDKKGDYIPVDLRGEYLEQAKEWKAGDRMRATLGLARSRYTPDMVKVFTGKVKLQE